MRLSALTARFDSCRLTRAASRCWWLWCAMAPRSRQSPAEEGQPHFTMSPSLRRTGRQRSVQPRARCRQSGVDRCGIEGRALDQRGCCLWVTLARLLVMGGGRKPQRVSDWVGELRRRVGGAGTLTFRGAPIAGRMVRDPLTVPQRWGPRSTPRPFGPPLPSPAEAGRQRED